MLNKKEESPQSIQANVPNRNLNDFLLLYLWIKELRSYTVCLYMCHFYFSDSKELY